MPNNTNNLASDESRETVKQFLKRRRIGWEFGSFPHHKRLARALTRVGFVVKTIERSDAHPVWSLSLRPGTVSEWRQPMVIRRLISQVLRELGHKCPAREIGVYVTGQVVQVAFVWKMGTPGIVTFWGSNRVRAFTEH